MNRLFPSNTLTRALALCSVLLATGCGGLVYKQSIQQGNVLDREEVEQLETGMTKRQVQVLLGTPSVDSPFHQDRWDYMNTYARRGGTPTRRVLTLHFDGNRLASIDGDYLDETQVAGEALDELQAPDELPVQDLETIRDQAERNDPGG